MEHPTRQSRWFVLPLIATVLLANVQWTRGIRQVKERVQLAEPTGEANPRVDQIEFDPLIAELEQEEDDKKWLENYKKSHDEWTHGHDEQLTGGWEMGGEEALEEVIQGEDLDLEDFEQGDPVAKEFLREDRLNVTDRIIKLFPSIDISPPDGKISLDEMVAWHVKQGKRASIHRTQREMEGCDANVDGHASLQEALVAMGVGDPNNVAIAEQRELYTERFHIADVDNNTLLNMTEFNDFLHPEESTSDELHMSIARDEMKHRDMDGDMKLNLNEWEMTTHGEVEHLIAEYDDPTDEMSRRYGATWEEDPEKAQKERDEKVQGNFATFDKDGDGFLDLAEFRVVADILWPSQRSFAKHHSRDIVKQADYNKDGALSLEEMLHRPHAFYHTVEDHGDQKLHDEF